MNNVSVNESSPLKPLKYPGLGLFASFKYVYLVIMQIMKYAIRGFTYVFIDIPVTLWGIASGGVDKVYRKAKSSTNKENSKSNLLSMDISDLFKNSHYMKKKMALLEKEKLVLLEELKGPGAIRSKEAKPYRFTAKNRLGKIETDIMNGFSKLDIHTFLVQDGYDVYKIENTKVIDFLYGNSSIFSVRLKTKDLLFWLTQLSTYLKSGITLTESIRILNLQMNKKPRYKRAFNSIIYELTMGNSFSTALEKQGEMFPPLLINMIKAAEATGELEETLDDMANYYEEIDKTHKQMISAITYPTVIMLFSIAVITFILVWVIPEFVKIYKSSGSEIKGLTLFVIHLSEFLQNYLALLILAVCGVIIALALCYKRIKAFRKAMQTFAMKLPLVGKIIIYNEMTIFSKTFSSLLRNNVFITDSINILSKITNNEIYKEIMYNTIDNVIKGEKISKAFEGHWAVPDVAYYMIVTGESTGELAEMMSKVSNYYQEMHRNIINNLKSFIEPVLICFLAVVVGMIILAVIVPMFDLMNQVQ